MKALAILKKLNLIMSDYNMVSRNNVLAFRLAYLRLVMTAVCNACVFFEGVCFS